MEVFSCSDQHFICDSLIGKLHNLYVLKAVTVWKVVYNTMLHALIQCFMLSYNASGINTMLHALILCFML